MGEEEIAALPEAELDRRLQALLRLAVEGSRLAREKAVDAGPPLLAHASRLDPGSAGRDTTPLDDERGETAPAKVPRNGKPGDPGTDDRDVGLRPAQGVQALVADNLATMTGISVTCKADGDPAALGRIPTVSDGGRPALVGAAKLLIGR